MKRFLVLLFFASTAWAQLPPLGPQPLAAAPPLQITTTGCPAIAPGVPYQCQFTATGGTPPYHWSVIAGNVPPGLTLSDSGLLSGTVYICSNNHPTGCFQQWPTNLQMIMSGSVVDIPTERPRKRKRA